MRIHHCTTIPCRAADRCLRHGGGRRTATGAAVPVGAAVVDITPDYPIRMLGYESRKTESEGIASRLKARALAIGGDDGDGPSMLVAIDNCAIGVEDHRGGRGAAEGQGRAEARAVRGLRDAHALRRRSESEIPFIFGKPLPADQAGRIDALHPRADRRDREGRAGGAGATASRRAWPGARERPGSRPTGGCSRKGSGSGSASIRAVRSTPACPC